MALQSTEMNIWDAGVARKWQKRPQMQVDQCVLPALQGAYLPKTHMQTQGYNQMQAHEVIGRDQVAELV